MKSKFIFTIIILLLISGSINAQTIKGKVYGISGDKKSILSGAKVSFLNSEISTITDSRGFFSLTGDTENFQFITVEKDGFLKEKVNIENKVTVFVYLKSNDFITEEIEVKDSRRSILKGTDIKEHEVFTQLEFRKASCCDLSGCFGNTVSVETKVTDAVSNNKELKLLGLEGFYTQILFDGIPIFSGLNARYGMGGIPGTMIDRITVSKGTNSVIQGTESMSGILNVIPKDFISSERLFVNVFMNGILEKQLNLNSTIETGNWQSILIGHITSEAKRTDENNDNFLDAPLINRQMIFNKWNFENGDRNFRFEFAGRFNSEKIIGGEKTFNSSTDLGTKNSYGQVIDFNIFDLYTKAGRVFDKSELKFFSGFSRHNQNSYFGILNYKAEQNIFYMNLFWEKFLSQSISLKSGLSYKFDHLKETINTGDTVRTFGGNYDLNESIPGIFSELSIDDLIPRLSVLAGLRIDFNNRYYNYVTPRILMKYDLDDKTSIRSSFGTGFKSPRIFVEHANVLSSSRDIIIQPALSPEKLFNFGVNIQHEFSLSGNPANVIADFYRSDFSNRIISDYDRTRGKVYFEDLNGSASSDVFQTELNITLFDNFELRSAYKYTRFRINHNDIEYEEPFIPKHQILTSFSYILPDNSWMFDATANWFGKRKLPSTINYPVQYKQNEFSEPYSVLNLQLTKLWKTFEIYAGVENLLDKKQSNPVIASDDPFGPYFDTSFIYAPVMGREFYGGIRFRIFD